MLPWIRLQTSYLAFCAALCLICLFLGICFWYQALLIFLLLGLSDWMLSSFNPYSLGRKTLIFLGFFLMPGSEVFYNASTLLSSFGSVLLILILGLAYQHFGNHRNWLPLILLPSLFLGLVAWELALLCVILALTYFKDRSDESWLWTGSLILPPVILLALNRENVFIDSPIIKQLVSGFEIPRIFSYDWSSASNFALVQHYNGDYSLFMILGLLLLTGFQHVLPTYFQRLIAALFVTMIGLSFFSPFGAMPSGVIYLGILSVGTILMQPGTVQYIRSMTVHQKWVFVLLLFFGLLPLYARTGW
ncbi:MAG: hypothetical protein H3C47_03460 [Candidatus Cloacimonetes bacterium]|nr:hypothetical protein [Candidatus Cloacimonadota bacterium]